MITIFTTNDDGIDVTNVRVGTIGHGSRHMGSTWAAPGGFRAWVADMWTADGKSMVGHNGGVFPTNDSAIDHIMTHHGLR